MNPVAVDIGAFPVALLLIKTSNLGKHIRTNIEVKGTS